MSKNVEEVKAGEITENTREVKIERKKVQLGEEKEDALNLDARPKVSDMNKEEILSELKELEKLANEQTSQLAETEYPIKIENDTYLKELIKFVERDLPWQHRNAALLVSLHSELKQAKLTKIDKDGNIWILGKDIAHLYNSLAQRSGTGFFEAKTHVRLVTIIGETVSESMKMVADDNQILRDIHTRLTELDKRNQEIDIEESGVKEEDVEKVKASAKKLDEAKITGGEVLEKAEDVTKED
jgi:hypothetical protein